MPRGATLRVVRAPLISAVATYLTSGQVVLLAVIVLAAAGLIFWLWALIDVFTWPSSAWDSTGLSQMRWTLRVFILGWIGGLWYVRSARRQLKAAHDERA